MTSSPDGRRRRGAATRLDILDAAETEFADRGFERMSIRAIAKAVGMSAPGVARHFADKDTLFAAMLERIQERNVEALRTEGVFELPPLEQVSRLLERLNMSPSESVLYTILLGEARHPEHAGHAHLVRQIPRVQALLEAPFGDEAAAVYAGWEGLRLLRLYQPERVDPSACLQRRIKQTGVGEGYPPLRLEAGDRSPAVRRDPAPLPDDADLPLPERIVRAAGLAFARDGFRRARIRGIAADLGIPHTTLIYYFPTKDALLRGVLDAGGRPDAPRITSGDDAVGVDYLREMYELAFVRPPAGDISRVRSALAFEAVDVEHPAREYFVERYGRLLDRMCSVYRGLAEDGLLRPGVEPQAESVWMLALWEGLRIQSFYRDDIDTAELVRVEMNRSLVRSARLER